MFLVICAIFIVWSQQNYVNAECPPIISKKEWEAADPKFVQYLNPPVDLVIIQHTVTQTCLNDKDCAETVRDIQKTHVEQSILADIGPSFLIGGNGKVYEGRGWNRIAIHTPGFNKQSIAIAFIGNFNNQEPSPTSLEAARALIQCGVDENRLTANHSVVSHKQLIPTMSPGDKLFKKIMLWPDWIQDVTKILERMDTKENLRETKKSLPLVSTTTPMTTTTHHKTTTGTPVIIEERFMILTTPKKIDLLTSIRDVIIELINNLRDLALQVLKTVDSLARGVARQIKVVLDKILAIFNVHKEQINTAVSVATRMILPNTNCVKAINKESNDFFDDVESKIRACASTKAKEVDDLIKSLGTLANNAIRTADNTAEDTRNCTELNFQIEAPTRECLNSVKGQTQNAITNFQSQKTLILNSIQTALDSLSTAIEECSQQHVLKVSEKTMQFTSSISSCSVQRSFGLFSRTFF